MTAPTTVPYVSIHDQRVQLVADVLTLRSDMSEGRASRSPSTSCTPSTTARRPCATAADPASPTRPTP